MHAHAARVPPRRPRTTRERRSTRTGRRSIDVRQPSHEHTAPSQPDRSPRLTAPTRRPRRRSRPRPRASAASPSTAPSPRSHHPPRTHPSPTPNPRSRDPEPPPSPGPQPVRLRALRGTMREDRYATHVTGPRRLGRARLFAVALLVAAAAALTLARPAEAGTYTVTQCSSVTRLRRGEPGSAAPTTTTRGRCAGPTRACRPSTTPTPPASGTTAPGSGGRRRERCSPASRRTPASPTRPATAASSSPPARAASRSAFGVRAQRLSRPLDQRRVHPVHSLAALRRARAPASPAGAPATTPPTPTCAASTCAPRTARRRSSPSPAARCSTARSSAARAA